MSTVGFVGVGAMGSRMVGRLLDHGHRVVAWARTPARLADLAERGLELADSPRAVAERTDVVLGCLLDDEAITRVYLGGDGLLAAARPGHLFVEHGTFSAALARRLAERAALAGASFVDAPVTGGPEGAAAGTLVAMAGGDPVALADRAELFAAYLASIRVVGPAGAGVALKLVNQLLVAVHMTAAAEAAVLLERSGIALDDAYAVLTAGWAGSTMLERELPRAMRGDFGESAATIGGLAPVLDLVARALDDAGVASVLLPPVRARFGEAVAGGLGGADPAALVTLYREPSA